MILLALLACTPDPSEKLAPQLPAAAAKTTLGTLRELGGWTMVAEVRRTETGGASHSSVERFEIKWKDDDHWTWVHTRDGQVRTEVHVWKAVAWVRSPGTGRLDRKGDAEGWRVQLASVWDPWRWGLEGLAEQLDLTAGPVELTDGRRAVHYTVASRPAERGAWRVSSAHGDVWIDEATALRTKGALTVEAVGGAATRTVELNFSIDGIGLDPDISAPARDTR